MFVVLMHVEAYLPLLVVCVYVQTMVATRLAAVSQLDCAVMSGGDVGPLGKVLLHT